MLKVFSIFGAYILLLGKVLRKPQKTKVFFKLFMREIYDLGVNSFGLVLFTSLFVGAVVAIQMYNNFKTASIPIPLTYIGHATKVVLILEFAPTIISVILAGKVGSYIASSIGTMRVTEQIDALDIMGVNSVNYLVFPKIVALMLMPFLIALGMYLGVLGGWASAVMSGYTTSAEFVQGVQYDFKPYSMIYAFTKTIVFAFFLATIPSYHGYYMKGGALDVGKASTVSFVWTSIVIILSNSVLTQLFYA